MPHFFFHIRDGKSLLPDDIGGEFKDLSEARGEAVNLAKCSRRDMGDIGEAADYQAVEICDEHGNLVDIVEFSNTSIDALLDGAVETPD